MKSRTVMCTNGIDEDSSLYSEIDTEYRRLSNQVRWETRNAVKLKEKNIAKHVKENPKVIWQYVTSKTRTKSRISDLYKDDTKLEKNSK